MEKTRFINKIGYSLTKIGKYEEMSKEGLRRAIKYYISLIFILSIILGIGLVYSQASTLNKAINCIEEKLPEFTFSNNKLSFDNEKQEEIKLDDEDILKSIGNIVVINPNMKEKDAIEKNKELSKDTYGYLIFIEDEYILIDKDKTNIYKYEDVSSKYIEDLNKEYKKEDVLNYLKNYVKSVKYIMYIGFYHVIVNFLVILFIYNIYLFIVYIIALIACKISKIKDTKRRLLSKTLYSSTLGLIIYAIYMAINYFTKISVPYLGLLPILIMCFYLGLTFGKKKKEEK